VDKIAVFEARAAKTAQKTLLIDKSCAWLGLTGIDLRTARKVVPGRAKNVQKK
jgi:hypothetical protein